MKKDEVLVSLKQGNEKLNAKLGSFSLRKKKLFTYQYPLKE